MLFQSSRIARFSIILGEEHMGKQDVLLLLDVSCLQFVLATSAFVLEHRFSCLIFKIAPPTNLFQIVC